MLLHCAYVEEAFLRLRQHSFDVFGYLAGFRDGGLATNLRAIA